MNQGNAHKPCWWCRHRPREKGSFGLCADCRNLLQTLCYVGAVKIHELNQTKRAR